MSRKIQNAFAVLTFLVGAGLFFYPKVTELYAAHHSQRVLENFKEEMVRAKMEAGEKSAAEDGSGEGQGGLDRLYRDMDSYNQALAQGGQSNVNGAYDYETPCFDLSEYGLSEDVIGQLWVPRMKLRLPIYLGANSANMARGAGLLGQTSMPLGKSDSNAVLAGHRGYKGIPMFRDIQSLQTGDKIQITTPWDTLVYRVCERKIILPSDAGEILIREGRDLVTLLTCHPYTKNYQRYMVVAEHSLEEAGDEASDLAEAAENATDEVQEITVVTEEGSTVQEINPSALRPVRTEGSEEWGAGYSSWQIWLETYLPYMGGGLILLLSIAGLCFGRRRRKK